VILDGDCERSVAVGAWFTWADGRLAFAVGYGHGVQRGVEIK
jgi:hypothetical protein